MLSTITPYACIGGYGWGIGDTLWLIPAAALLSWYLSHELLKLLPSNL